MPEAEPGIDVSVVVPVYDEVDNVGPLSEEIAQAFAGRPERFELIFVDDGSKDGTADAAAKLAGVRLVRHPSNQGQSAATLTGIWHARGEIVVTLDGDGQNDPAGIPDLLDALPSHDMAQGIRGKRRDSLWRRFGSRMAFLIRNLFIGDGIIDIGCSLRAFYRAEGRKLPGFDGLHRWMPAIYVLRGLKVTQVKTNHRPRTAGRSKYGNLSRGVRGFFDLLAMRWLRRRTVDWMLPPLALAGPEADEADPGSASS